jgi:TonB family protein
MKINKLTFPAISAIAMLIVAAPAMLAQSEKHLSAAEALSAAIAKPQPEYTPIAKQLRLEGVVNMNAFVTEDGNVDKVELVSGNPILAKSAEDALKKWKFNKIVEDGKPVRFVASISFRFNQLQ